MKLYSSRIAAIATEVIRTLKADGSIDVAVEDVPEAELDVQGVLREYNRMDRDLTTKARELADQGRGSFGRNKRHLAARNNFKIGDEAIDYVVDQLIEVFLHSHHVEEIYADDLALRKSLSDVIKKHVADQEGQLDEKVRKRIKNLSEGGVAWDDEYDRVMSRLKREQDLE